jgi:uncharacterized RDD family membrane protein YckC
MLNDDDPYRSPQIESGESSRAAPRYPANVDTTEDISTANTVVPRYLAAFLDNLIAMSLAVLAAKSVSEDSPATQFLALLAAYLGYYFLSEGFASRTPGKLMTGLVVVQTDGRPCLWRHVFIRTGFRVLEVNPILLGGLPAAACILFSKRHQRFGDRFAHTIVVPPQRLTHVRTSAVGPPKSPVR